MEREYVKSDCADTCTYPRMTLKFIRSRPSRIQTYDICLFTGSPSEPENLLFKTRKTQTMRTELESV